MPASHTAAALAANSPAATSIDTPANTPLGYLLVEERWVALDVGETLIDETRVWSAWADALGIPRLTFMAALGAAMATGDDFRDTFDTVGIEDWSSRRADVEAAYGGFQAVDLYPDALPAVEELCRRGLPGRDPRQPARQPHRRAASAGLRAGRDGHVRGDRRREA